MYAALNTGKWSSEVSIVKVTANSFATPKRAVPSAAQSPQLSRVARAVRRLKRTWQTLAGGSPETVFEIAPKSVGSIDVAQALQIDLLHVPYQTPPTHELSVPFIVTMHDVQELHFPEYFSAEERASRATGYLRAIRNASAVVVSFDHVRDDLIRYFDCPEDRIFTIPLPYANCTLPSPDANTTLRLEEYYTNAGPIILYPAQTWEHKNHLRLIDAFETVCRTTNSPAILVCTGKKNCFFYSHIEPRLKASQFANRIYFPGIIDEAELRWLYENCVGVVIPTLYEAGSFPLIEAMSLGAPVVCASTTSLPETIGNRKFIFDPRNVVQIRDQITELLLNNDFREESRRNGRSRISILQSADICSHYERLWTVVLRRKEKGNCEGEFTSD
ncbi:MAG: glycosyltransferase family 1 protein [Planctomycetaceae bacterium]